MNELPIPMNDAMARAVANGSKRQTRRIVKPQPTDAMWDKARANLGGDTHGAVPVVGFGGIGLMRGAAAHARMEANRPTGCGPSIGFVEPNIQCPYGRTGNRLWVQESAYIDLRPFDDGPLPEVKPAGIDGSLYYRADGSCCEQIPECCCAEIGKPKWRQPIHMPRWAARSILTITDVRLQRLQDISEADAIAEGLKASKDGSLFKYGIPDRDGLPGNDSGGWHWSEWEKDPRNAFRKLWESIYGPGSWDANPWVWALTFEKVKEAWDDRPIRVDATPSAEEVWDVTKGYLEGLLP